MDKLEIASYLVSLSALLEAQSKGSHSIPSTVLAEEYNKYWSLLKDAINSENEKEKQYEARSRNNVNRGVDKDRAPIASGKPRGGE